MRKLLFFLTLTFLPLIVRAQITSLKVEVKADGHAWQAVIQNHGSSAVMAMRTTFREQPGIMKDGSINTAVVVVYDSVTHYGPFPPIAPGGTAERAAQDPSKWTGGVDAAIFSDGHSEGDPQGVNDIYERRRGAYNAVVKVIPLLDSIATQGANPSEVADTIHGLYQSLPKDRTITDSERLGLGPVYLGVENLLRTQGDIAGLYDPTKYPPQPGISEVAKVSGIPREQAHAIVISKKYQGLKALLEANLQPATTQ
jgi:hypothetical protein